MLPAIHLSMRRWWTARRAARIIVPAALLVLFIGGISGLPHAQSNPQAKGDLLTGSSPHSKLNRQLAVFERVLDDLLIESDHALVDHGRNALGTYLPGQGAVFGFEFSLVAGGGSMLALGDGNFRFLHPSDDDDLEYFDLEDDDDDRDRDDKDRDEKDRDRDRRRRIRIKHFGSDDRIYLDEGELKEHRTRQYGKVKQELIDALGEYGDLLEGLPADEWVTLTARPRDLPWGERRIKRLVIRARIRDIAERANDRIDEATFEKRVEIEEYK